MADTLLLNWVEVLEKEFDKAFVDLDILLKKIAPDECELTLQGRLHMASLSAVFVKLNHKTQTISLSNVIMQERLADMRSDIIELQATKAVVEQELHTLLLQLHSSQLEVQELRGLEVDSQEVKKKLEADIARRQQAVKAVTRLETETKLLMKDNNELREYMLVLQSELFGARLSAKYAETELYGRIQQLQMLDQGIRGTIQYDKLWGKIEAEISVHRHKVAATLCHTLNIYRKALSFPPGNNFQELKKRNGLGDTRVVTVQKEPEEEFGISLKGGDEYRIPSLISEIYEGQPADRCGQLYVGDAILSVNDIDLRHETITEAGRLLSQQHGEIKLSVMFVAPDEEDIKELEEIVDFRNRICGKHVVGTGPAEACTNDAVPCLNGPTSPSASKNPEPGDNSERVGHSNISTENAAAATSRY